MRTIALVAMLLATAAPAFAADAVLKRGLVLRDANNVRLGVIDSVGADGSVAVIVDAKFVHLPADSVSLINGQAQTKLTKKDVKKL